LRRQSPVIPVEFNLTISNRAYWDEKIKSLNTKEHVTKQIEKKLKYSLYFKPIVSSGDDDVIYSSGIANPCAVKPYTQEPRPNPIIIAEKKSNHNRRAERRWKKRPA
jgi:hypothetical protein